MDRRRAVSIMRRNGLAGMLAGFAAGFGVVAVKIGGLSGAPLPFFIPVSLPGSAQGWLVLHLGMILNGMMAVMLANALRGMAVAPGRAAIICWGVVAAVWGNGAFYLFSMFAPNHGLTPGANALGAASLAGQLAYYPALVGAVGIIVALCLMIAAREADGAPR